MNAAAKSGVTTHLDLDAMRRNASDAVSLLKGLANESRLMILCVLSEGELSVGKLNQRINLSQSALSQHLAVLREQGLVHPRADDVAEEAETEDAEHDARHAGQVVDRHADDEGWIFYNVL